MNNYINKKINSSLRSLIFLFPLTLFIYLFLSDFGNFGNLFLLTKKLFYEITFGLFLISIGYLMRYYRWRIIINSFGFYPSANTESKLWLASYAFTATPGKIGELVMMELKKIDSVAYIRFSSVYREFKDISEFQAQIDDLKDKF